MFRAHLLKCVVLPCKYVSSKRELTVMSLGLNTKLKIQINAASRIKGYPYVNHINVARNLLKIPSRNYTLLIHTRKIHLSHQRNAIPPPLLFLIRPIVKLVAIFFGRTIRQWWSTLPPEQKQIVMDKIRKRTFTLGALFGSFIAAVLVLYVTHLEQDPITGRTRFIAFSHLQMVKIAEMELLHTVADFGRLILKQDNPEYARVLRVANRILKSNIDLPGMADREWTVTVVDDPDQINAMVLPNGNIFIFTGMLNACENDDQLGVILAHEMSHALLQHMAEQLSNVHLVEWLLLVPLVFIWALMPDGAALFSQWLSGRLATFMFHLPYSRAIETEADHVGLRLAAKACFDVREASAFWTRMSVIGDGELSYEWLSTHPNHRKRGHTLDKLIPAAIKFRAQCDCPELPNLDPRILVNEIVKRVKSEQAIAKTKH